MSRTSFQLKLMILLLSLGLLAACAQPRLAPFEPKPTERRLTLAEIPPPQQILTAAVYAFPDETGQFRQTQSGQAHYSRAVTQGAAAVLIDTLRYVSNGQWFRVVERNRLDHVLTERSIIRDMRHGAVDSQGNPLPQLRPLLYAGVIFEGSIVGYDTNTVTGGSGARLLGIGGHTEYREDVVTVNLRAVSSQTGEIWKSVMVSQRIYSMKIQADVFRFISTREILEMEAGFTRNKPRMVALQQAVEEAVYIMIMEGTKLNLWSFADEHKGQEAFTAYRERVNRKLTPDTSPESLETGS